jgi:hypothetical protein
MRQRPGVAVPILSQAESRVSFAGNLVVDRQMPVSHEFSPDNLK